ncbi:MAG: GNAT family N-acetyltransferase [Gammaproteobacteria bacterium]|nr:GNAT family N-acetyltransferase [Gammaproteobacteria bacterium]
MAQRSEGSVFTTWEWQYSWWKHYGADRQLRILVATDGREVVGILPLYLQAQRSLWLFSRTTIRFVGVGGDTSPEYLGPVVAPQRERQVVAGFIDHLLHHMQWDVLSLSDILSGSVMAVALDSYRAQVRLLSRKGLSTTNSYITLPGSWEVFLSSLHAKRRWRIRNNRRKIAKQFHPRFYVLEDADKLEQVMDRLIELHHKRWASRSASCAFSSDNYVAFHKDVMRLFFKRGWLKLYCLAIAGQLVAIDYCYCFKGRIYQFQRGFDPDYQRWKPGHVLLEYAIEDSINEGNAVFDFLRGQYKHKEHMTKMKQDALFYEFCRKSVGGFAFAFRYWYLPTLKQWVNRR